MHRRRRALLLLALAAFAVAPGCYTRVTDARGIGSDSVAPVRHKPSTTILEDIGNAVGGNDK